MATYRARSGRLLRLRTLLFGAMLVPILGAGALTGALVGDRWEQRQDSARLAEEATVLQQTIGIVSAVTDEQAHTSVHVLAESFGVEAPGDTDAAMARARAAVDEHADGPLADELAPALDELDDLRRSVDTGAVDFPKLTQGFFDVNGALLAVSAAQMEDVSGAADLGEQSARLRSRIRTLRESMEAMAPAGPRAQGSLQVDLGDRDPTVVTELVRANNAFTEAIRRIERGSGPAAAAAWERFRTDPAAIRMEEHLRHSEQVALGVSPSPFADGLEALVPAMTDGARWATLLADATRAAAADLADAAEAEAGADLRSMLWWATTALLIGITALAVAVVLARRILAPTRRLAAAARRVAAGELAVDPVTPGGSQELAEAVEAFNDMAATLAAVEAHAVAMADDAACSTPLPPLPGRTGAALQAALDRLRASIQEAEAQRAELAVLATRDELTGLLNRRATVEAIDRDLARVRREERTLAVLYVDLDGLKALNDEWGHAAGDDALRETASALLASVREGDVVGRLGGDEFLVATMVDVGDRAGVAALATRLHDAIRARYVTVGERSLPLSASIGVATSVPGASTEGLLGCADAALYDAKRTGRDRSAWATC